MTAISTGVLIISTVLLPSDEIKTLILEHFGWWWSGDPFVQLRFLGGLPGGFVAGYLARDHWGRDEWGAAMKYGVYAVLFGLALLFAAFVLYNIVRSLLTAGMILPPLYLITVVPLVYAIPLAPAYVVEALVAAIIGNGCSRLIRDPEMESSS
ncbi:hypothetical protein [Saliphagus infecundisoli]|uniref:Uncharacterized protein n=1 Tax=Saliphagus infecundisoli TaxID=1849069 RepID=A0ABD5QAY7_9EURY|nr:hypothetical protein [Saliphagus infecundisoli]